MSTVRDEERIFAWAIIAILGGFAGLIAWMNVAPRQFDRVTTKGLNLFFGAILWAIESAPSWLQGVVIYGILIFMGMGIFYHVYLILKWIWNLF